MLIDWFTVAAQAINFLVLVWLLQRFLYRPVLNTIDAREKKVIATLAEAATREAQAQAERADFQHRNEALDHQREDLLRTAGAEAAVERQRLIESARQEAQALRSKLAQTLADERAVLNQRLVAQTQAEVLALARGALSELAGVGLEARMTEVFLEHLHELQMKQTHLLPGGRNSVALVRSAFEIPSSSRPGIQEAIRKSVGADFAVHFETSPELVCGIELRVDGIKLAWSIADYLASISANLTALATPVSAREPLPVPTATPVTESRDG